MNNKALTAIKNNDLEALKKISFLGMGINKQSSWGDTLLTEAISVTGTPNLEIIEYLIKKGADVNLQGSFRRCALEKAVDQQSVEVFDLLLEHGASLEKFGRDYYMNALTYSYKAGAFEIANRILNLECPEDVKKPTEMCRWGKTAFIYACKLGKVSEVQKLYDYIISEKIEFDIEQKDSDGNTALLAAAYSGSIEVVEYLHQNCGANILVQNNGGYGILHRSAGKGAVEILKYALDNGVELEQLTTEKRTPLMVQALGGRFDQAKFLLEQGANINHQNKDGDTTLMLVVRCDNAEERIEFLLEHGANTHLKNKQSKNAVARAKKASYRELIERDAVDDNWIKLSDHEIVHTELKEQIDLTIKDIFNFKTRERTRVIENTKMASMAMEVTPLGKTSRETLTEAFQKLEKNGGKPGQYFQLTKGPSNQNSKPNLMAAKKLGGNG